MANLNKVMLMGNLTRDVEITVTPKGTTVGKTAIAVSRKYKTESGEQKEETTFVDITLFGRTAEVANQYASKGSPFFVEGRLQLDTWDDKQTGQKRSKLYLVGEQIQLLGSRNGGNGGHSSDDGGGDDYEERPAPRTQSGGQRPQGGGGQHRSQGGGQQRPAGASGGGSQSRPKPAPAPVDEDDDIPF